MRLFKASQFKDSNRGVYKMNFKLIKSNNIKYVNGGAFGDYSKIKNTNDGVKTCFGVYTSLTDAKNSHSFRLVKREFKRLKKINTMTRCVPKAKHLAIVEEFDKELNMTIYKCGYVMSHVKGKLARDMKLTYKDEAAIDAARARLQKKGIYQIDAHSANVIVKTVNRKKRFIFIDAGGLRFNECDSCDWS